MVAQLIKNFPSKVHYHVHKMPSLGHTLNQFILDRNLIYLIKIEFNVILSSRLKILKCPEITPFHFIIVTCQ
jgi:hypothetical protein